VGERAEWEVEARALLERSRGLQALAWHPQGGRRLFVASVPGGAVELPLDVESGAPARPGFLGPEGGGPDETSYRLLIPARRAGALVGTLVAQVRTVDFLEPVLRGRAKGYAVSVRWSGEEIISRGEPSQDPWQQWWAASERIALPAGETWEVSLRPTPALADARLTPLPHYLLAAGMLATLLLATLARQLQIIARQARFLAAANRALERRGDDLERLNVTLESRVAERTQELREAVTELETFNYSVSHDLRSPLGAILNFAAILEEDFGGRTLDDEGVGLLHRIRRSAQRASALLEDLLSLSRAGRAALSLEELDVEAVAREAFAQVRAAQRDDEIALELGDLPPVPGDRSLIAAVFGNLFSNAFKYSRGRAQRRVTVTGEAVEDECVYHVEDNGQGFDPRFSEKVFGLFERLHPDQEIEGTGLGLALVARIIKRHGGRVWAEGRPGEGARLSFSLPRSLEEGS
jgi:signal transduction histidine kinase